MRSKLFTTCLAAFIAGVLATGCTGLLEDHRKVTMKELSEGQVRSERLEDELVMHTYESQGLPSGSGSVTSFIFESDDSLLVFDVQMYKSAAEDLKSYIESLGKPVDKIILSHGHPDHGFGYAYMKDLGELLTNLEPEPGR